jgi:hypothetical protein
MHFGELDPMAQHALLSQQDQIGWLNFLHGRMLGFWQEASRNG